MMLYLFRHGKSVANSAGRVTGTPADPLADPGIHQATTMRAWIQDAGITGARFVTSNWLRAQQTASLMFPDATWEIDARLGETHAGSVADWPLSTFLARYPGFYDDNATPYPDGESHLDLNRRVMAWLESTLASVEPEAKIVAVAHSGPIACLLQHALQIDMTRFPALLPAHASLSVIEYRADGARVKAFSLTPATLLPSFGS